MKFNSKKRGQGMPINVIVIAAIALLILLVLITIFTGRIRIFGSAMKDCGSLGGTCGSTQSGCIDNDGKIINMDRCQETCTGYATGRPDDYVILAGTNCQDSGAVCCKRIII